MLKDALVHVSGPRLRDKWCHGLMDALPHDVVAHLIGMVAGLCASLQPAADPLSTALRAAVAGYKSLFHPSSLCTQELADVWTAIVAWPARLQPADQPQAPIDYPLATLVQKESEKQKKKERERKRKRKRKRSDRK